MQCIYRDGLFRYKEHDIRSKWELISSLSQEEKRRLSKLEAYFYQTWTNERWARIICVELKTSKLFIHLDLIWDWDLSLKECCLQIYPFKNQYNVEYVNHTIKLDPVKYTKTELTIHQIHDTMWWLVLWPSPRLALIYVPDYTDPLSCHANLLTFNKYCKSFWCSHLPPKR